MRHSEILEKAKEKLLEELVNIVSNKPDGLLDFAGNMIAVEDPDGDPEYGPTAVHVERLRYSDVDGAVYVEGSIYDDGALLGEADPMYSNILTVDEIDALLSQAKRCC